MSDLIEGIYRLLISDMNRPVNIGNPEEIQLVELAGTIKQLTKSPSKIVYRALPEDDPKVRCPNIELAKAKLKWSPKVSLREGLKTTIAYFRSEL